MLAAQAENAFIAYFHAKSYISTCGNVLSLEAASFGLFASIASATNCLFKGGGGVVCQNMANLKFYSIGSENKVLATSW